MTIHPPLDVGQRVGSVAASLHGRILGKVPLVVTALPPGAPEPPGVSLEAPWWSTSLDAIDRLATGVFHAVFG